MSKTRTIVVVTGTRAEFGLLDPVMRAIADYNLSGKGGRSKTRGTRGAGGCRLRLRTVVTGTHLTTGTWRNVRDAGFRIDARVPMQRRSTVSRSADVAALGRGVTGLGRQFAKLKADVVIVLGDRIEALAGACAASVGGYYLAHIHGGDQAQGVADESMRHAISKMAHIHFAATANSRRRLLRMGEHKQHVFQVGSPAADGLQDVTPAGDAPELIVIQHPIGAADRDEREWMEQTLDATAGYNRLVMAPNSDPGSKGIRAALKSSGVTVVENLLRERFVALLAGTGAITGNSSAGLIEAAVLKRPCVNIGPRQSGREAPGNVVACAYGERTVRAAVRRALRLDLRRKRHPYGDGHTGQRIAELLATIDLDGLPLHKRNSY